MYWGDILSLDLYQEPLNTTSVKIKTDQVQNNISNNNKNKENDYDENTCIIHNQVDY